MVKYEDSYQNMLSQFDRLYQDELFIFGDLLTEK